MSSTRFERPIVLEAPDRREVFSRHCAVVGLGLCWVLIAELDAGARIALILLGVAILLVPLRRERRVGARALWLPETGWCIEWSGQRRAAEIEPATRVFASYVAVILKTRDGRRYRFTATPRAVTPDQHRRLRVRLRFDHG